MHPADKRKNLRRTVRYPATIEVGDDSAPRQCTLCDASQEGAQILVDDPASVPDQFTLVLGYDGTARRRCRVMWRSDTQIGVEFTSRSRTARRRAAAAADAKHGASSKPNDPFNFDSQSSR
jgi:hypothetical protein